MDIKREWLRRYKDRTSPSPTIHDIRGHEVAEYTTDDPSKTRTSVSSELPTLTCRRTRRLRTYVRLEQTPHEERAAEDEGRRTLVIWTEVHKSRGFIAARASNGVQPAAMTDDESRNA